MMVAETADVVTPMARAVAEKERVSTTLRNINSP
jgi:hypothetical protein